MRKISLTILHFSEVIEDLGCPAEKVILQQDNDPKHTTRLVQNYIKRQIFSTLTLPRQ